MRLGSESALRAGPMGQRPRLTLAVPPILTNVRTGKMRHRARGSSGQLGPSPDTTGHRPERLVLHPDSGPRQSLPEWPLTPLGSRYGSRAARVASLDVLAGSRGS